MRSYRKRTAGVLRVPFPPRRNSTTMRETSDTRRWRRDNRQAAVSAAVSVTDGVRWSPRLVDTLLSELYVGDDFEELLGCDARGLSPDQFPKAVAVALILRHRL
jgi:hypothetical protein